ncbi:MAG TPA: aminoacyl-tRNA hydrolase [Gammaproteobacteria bacterium]|nr:aminoacyl-tRNA hydrolase [Gammaproteobacteria bacterium]
MANWLIVGLGNPGAQYHQTRHNAGFWWLDALAQQQQLTFRAESKMHGEACRYAYDNHTIHLLKPTTFMNHSGRSVSAMARFYQIPAAQLLVVHDELDLPAGTVKLKQAGGHGGHNGLRDIISQLGHRDFLRCRLGIEHPGHSTQVTHHVLSKPSLSERSSIDGAITQSLHCLPDILNGQLAAAMQWLHSQ